MNPFIALLAGAALVLVFFGAKKFFGRIKALVVTKGGKAPFEARPVMNRGEYDLYLRLLDATPAGTLVLAQVQLSSFLQVKGLKNAQERWQYLNRIIRLSVDFLVVDAQTMRPLVGIELDGDTHRGTASFASGQMDADARKNQAFQAAGVSLIRIPVRERLAMAQLRQKIMTAIGA